MGWRGENVEHLDSPLTAAQIDVMTYSKLLLYVLATVAVVSVHSQARRVAQRPLKDLPYSPSLDLSAMDKTADPCVDFYQYTCGGWMKNNPIPADQASWSVYGKLANDNEQFLWGLLEETASASADRTSAQQKIGDYFQACMDEAAVERLGASPLAPSLQAIIGLGSKDALATYLGHEHLEVEGDATAEPGVPLQATAFGFGSKQDFENSSQVIAFAVAGGLGLPDRDYYTKGDDKSKEIRAKYVAHVQQVFQLLGDKPAVAAAEAKTVMVIETSLAKASLTMVDKRDPYKLFHKMDRAKLRALMPAFRWEAYLSEQGLENVQTFNVTEPAFFQELNRLILAESLANWKTYLRWHLAHAWAPYLSSNFQQANFDFFGKTLRGVSEMPPRWKRCVRWVDRDLGEALGQVFVAKTFSADTKARALDMTKRIEAEMEADIRQLTWMGDATKQQALEKLHTVVNKIGYPDKWRDYSALAIERGDFAGNVRRSAIFESKRRLAKIGKPLDRGEWNTTPPTVNAYYRSQMNDITFPAGVLQPPLFDPRMDDAPNYGNTGGGIGHELTHGFDDEGRQFDARGNLRDWWTPEDARRFEDRVQCVRDEYAQFTIVDEIKINSKLTSGEDVADLGGTLLAYVAWKKATQGKDLKPINGLTPDQRFFIGYAQWACENQRPENLRVSALTNPHSPGRYRVNGLMGNYPEFQQAFGCKAGQPMVRQDRCRVW